MLLSSRVKYSNNWISRNPSNNQLLLLPPQSPQRHHASSSILYPINYGDEDATVYFVPCTVHRAYTTRRIKGKWRLRLREERVVQLKQEIETKSSRRQAPSVYFTLWETIINFHVVHCRLNSISLSCLLPSKIEWSVVSSLLWYRTCFYGFSFSCVFVVVAPTGILSFCDGVGS